MIEDFISNDANHFEALFAGNAVHDHVAVDANEVLAVQDSIFILYVSTHQYKALQDVHSPPDLLSYAPDQQYRSSPPQSPDSCIV